MTNPTKLVPVEPTEEMLEAADGIFIPIDDNRDAEIGRGDRYRIYKAMLEAASPQAPVSGFDDLEIMCDCGECKKVEDDGCCVVCGCDPVVRLNDVAFYLNQATPHPTAELLALPGNVRSRMDNWALRIDVETGRMIQPANGLDGEWITVRTANKIVRDELQAALDKMQGSG